MGCSHSKAATSQHERKTFSQEDVPVAVVESPTRDYKQDYRVLKKVGGGVSKIYMVQPTNMTSGKQVFVLQVIDLNTVAPERRSLMRRELLSLLDVSHPNSTWSLQSCGLFYSPSLNFLSIVTSSRRRRCLRLHAKEQYRRFGDGTLHGWGPPVLATLRRDPCP